MAYVITDGIVDRTYFEGKGVTFHEEFKKRDGTTGKAYFKAWFEEAPGLSEGDRGTFKGNLSVKVDEYENSEGVVKHTAEVSINNARFEIKDDDEPF